jgi:nicotinamide-nucleotide amidase
MAWMTVRKLDHAGRLVTAYPGRVLHRTATSIALETAWERLPLDLGYVVLETGDRWVEFFYADRWYNAFRIHAADGRLKGIYCNITRPAEITATTVSAEDLALDLWIDPQGRLTVLDEDEFAALPLTATERAAAQAARAALERMAAQGTGPWAQEVTQMEEPLEAVVGKLLLQRRMTLAVAESCTGGLVGHRITNVAGSSAYYLGSVTAYAYEAKEALLGVRRATLYEHGAVSAETAQEMAQGVRRALRSDLGLSVTGIAGPDGGTPDKPVGLVYIALAAPDSLWVEQHIWRGDRLANKAASAEAALDLVRRYLTEELAASTAR